MLYSESSVVATISGAPTRVQRSTEYAAFPRPEARASNLERFFRFVAISQDPFARVIHTPAPLAGRHCPESPTPVSTGITQYTNRLAAVPLGLRTPRRCYFNIEIIGEKV